MGGVDWLALHDELLPRARAATTNDELKPVVEDMFGRLGWSHFNVLGSGPEGIERLLDHTGLPGDSGLHLRLIEGQLVVVGAQGPAAEAGIRPGWTLAEVDGQPTTTLLGALRDSERRLPLLAMAFSEAWVDGSAGTTARLQLLDGDNTPLQVELRRGAPPGQPAKLGHLPTRAVDLVARRLQQPDGQQVGYVAFDAFLVPVPTLFADAVQDFVADPVAGLVLDLRGNTGGLVNMVMGLAGHFIAGQGTSLGTLVQRDTRLTLVALPKVRAQRYDGPLAVLVDGESASTAEIMAAGLQQLGRARVFGQTTVGMALPSLAERMPNGDLIQFAFADFLLPDGSKIEGAGLRPNVPVPRTRRALLDEGDPTLAAALAWLGGAVE